MNIILIHLGKKKIPYILYTIYHLLYFNNKKIFLLVNKNTFDYIKKIPIIKKINLVNVDEFEKSYEHEFFLKKTKLDKYWYYSFWLKTSERFFYLENFAKNNKLRNIIHLENDNLVFYDLDKLKNKFKKIYKIGLTLLNNEQCIPGFIYFKNYKYTKIVSDHFFNFHKKFLQIKTFNDMEILADLKKKNKYVKLLPTISKDMAEMNMKNIDRDYYKNYEKLKFLFDAAAAGQKLDGLDPKIHKNKGTFINNKNIISPDKFEIIIKKSTTINRPFIKFNNKLFPLINIHMHSKNTKYFINNK
jgi:hypothetical protein